MRVYGQMLERAGALVEWIPAGNMDCVTKSQLVRYIFDVMWYVLDELKSSTKLPLLRSIL